MPVDLSDCVPRITRGHLKLFAPPRAHDPEPIGVIGGPLLRAQDAEGQRLLRKLSNTRLLGLHVSGLPGTGKSTLFLHLILDDIRNGRACCVIDPHGDLVTAILEHCSAEPETAKRILVFDPADTDYPVGLDLLDATSERQRERAVQFMVSLYETLFLRDQQGPILHQSLANGMRLLMEQAGTLAELPGLFLDERFLRRRLDQCQNPWVRQYFEGVWLGSSKSSRGESLAYFTSKLSGFLDDPMMRNILGQKGGPDLEAHLNGGGVVLARLCAGSIGNVNARLLGMILLHKLEEITRARERLEPSARRPVHVYIDEFGEMATDSLAEFLPCARKYGVGIHLAHQHMATLTRRVGEAVLASIGHWILFRQSCDTAFSEGADMLWPRFSERDVLSCPNHQALAKITDEDGGGHVGRLVVPAAETASGKPGLILEESRYRFGQPRRVVEEDLLKRMA